jgi:amidase
MDLIWKSALRQAEAIVDGEISAVELVHAHLKRIESQNPFINAVVQTDSASALEQASLIDRAIRDGKPVGPLAGVPFTAKDNIETANIVTTIGVDERRQTIPDRDATIIHRMKSAGAILIGKTNCPPWGGGLETDNTVYGRTVNPYDPARTPGGSSGGEAAAIATGMSAMGLGTDSGGSLRYPAHFCGIATIKPTAGRVPLTGILDDLGSFGPLRDPRTQAGPMARYVGDLSTMLRIISGPDPFDPGVLPYTPRTRDTTSPNGLRVAVQYSNGIVPPTEETAATLQEAAHALSEHGANVVDADLPDEGMGLVKEIWRSYGDEMSARELYELLAEWDLYRSRLNVWFQSFDLILRPVNATPAPPHGETNAETLYTIPFSLTGWPAAVVRCGTSPEELPIGLQIISHPWQDRLALRMAWALEGIFGGWRKPPEH